METQTEQITETKKTTIHQQIFACEDRDQRKKLLKELSKGAKAIVKMTEGAQTVNEILLEWYTNEEHAEFHGFWEWKKLGYKVKKGAKGFFIWSKKRKAKEKHEDKEDEEYSFYSLAYLFSNAQVEPLKMKEDA